MIFFCSMMSSAAMAKTSGPTVLRRARHAFAGGEIEHMFAVLLQQAAQVAIADETRKSSRLRRPSSCPEPLRDIS